MMLEMKSIYIIFAHNLACILLTTCIFMYYVVYVCVYVCPVYYYILVFILNATRV